MQGSQPCSYFWDPSQMLPILVKKLQYAQVGFIHIQIYCFYLSERYHIFKHVFVYTHLASIPLAESWSEHSEILCMSFQWENLPSQNHQLKSYDQRHCGREIIDCCNTKLYKLFKFNLRLNVWWPIFVFGICNILGAN